MADDTQTTLETYLERRVAEAIDAERERCARIARSWKNPDVNGRDDLCEDIAKDIERD